MNLENFERAFADGCCGCRRTCACGLEFYDASDNAYDWEKGELEKLQADPDVTGLPYAPGDISFEGKHYVDGCDCWHKRAEHIMAFLDGHKHKIAKYLTLEKQRLQAIADAAPTVEGKGA